MTRELAALDLLAELAACGIVVWVNDAPRQWDYRDPHGLFSQDRRARLVDLSRELEQLCNRFGCRDGYVRGATRWHVMLRRGSLTVQACGSAAVRPDSGCFDQLPAYAPGGELCSRCVAILVDRELARLPRVTPGREERV
jgi:hypothetical protein